MAKQALPELEQERDGIGEAVAEERQANDPIADAVQVRQPEKPKVNLDEFDEFRKFRAEMDKRLAKERQERERLAAQYQQQLEQERRAREEKELAGMDDYQRTQYERDKAIREAAYWREQAAMVAQQTDRQRGLSELINEYSDTHGVTIPITEFDEVTTPAEAYRVANRYVKQQLQEQRQRTERDSEERRTQREEKRAANKVDTGAGIGSTPKSDFEREYEAALKSGNSAKLARFLLPQG